MDDDGFVRQRRNLIIISFLLLFAHDTGLKLEEINVLGNTAELAKAFRIEPVLWTAWVYFLWRYWQAFHEYKERGFLNIFLELYRQRLDYQFKNKFPDPPFPGDWNGTYEEKPIANSVVGSDCLEWSKARARILYAYKCLPHLQTPNTSQEVDRILTAFDVWKIRFRTFFYIAFNRSVLTELHLPFAIAAIPLLYAAYIFFSSGPELLNSF